MSEVSNGTSDIEALNKLTNAIKARKSDLNFTRPTLRNTSSIMFYEEIRLIPHSPATEPWELKKFLNCVKMASERLKEDGGKFDEKRFVKSAMTRLDGEAFDYVFRMNPNSLQEMEQNVVRFFTISVEAEIESLAVVIKDHLSPPLKQLNELLDRLQKIRDGYMNMGIYCRDRDLIEELLIKKTLATFSSGPYRLERVRHGQFFRIFKNECMDQASKW